LVITASSAVMTVGGAVPAITPSYSGFANGDTAASLTAQPVCSTAATTSSSAGSYPSVCSGAVDSKYTISYVVGTVAVVAASAPGSGGTTGGVGATLPYVEFEAEDAVTNGVLLGPSRAFGTIAAESSGREAVQLNTAGQYVQFVTTAPANSVVVRYVIPDAAAGGGINATLGLYINGVRTQSLQLTSVYSWLYGGDTNSADKNPANGGAHHFYDEVHALIGELPTGTTVALQRDSQDTAAYYVIDLVDFEEVGPPLAQPAGSISITSYGATPNDGSDDSAAIQAAIAAAASQDKTLWIPPGVFNVVANPLNSSGVSIQGAGMWYSTLAGVNAEFNFSGNNNQLSDFALFGGTVLRNDALPSGLNGPFGTGSTFTNLWIEHQKAAIWAGQGSGPGAPTNGLIIHGVRIRDIFADGVNFCCGTSNSVVEQSSFRNTGDDALASWSLSTAGPINTNNTFKFNTVQNNWRANCFAIYGGSGTTVEDSLCSDTVNYPGILIGSQFTPYPFAGATTAQRITLNRTGGTFDGGANGAVEITATDSAINSPVILDNILINSSTLSGIQIEGPYPISALWLRNITDSDAGTQGIWVFSNASGSVQATNVVITNPGAQPLENDAGSAFIFNQISGDSGW